VRLGVRNAIMRCQNGITKCRLANGRETVRVALRMKLLSMDAKHRCPFAESHQARLNVNGATGPSYFGTERKSQNSRCNPRLPGVSGPLWRELIRRIAAQSGNQSTKSPPGETGWRRGADSNPETFVDREGQIVPRSGSLFGLEIAPSSAETLFRYRFAQKMDQHFICGPRWRDSRV